MTKVLRLLLTALAFTAAPYAQAGQAEFCAGFSEGYKSIKGDLAVVPVCPVAPVTPVGSTDYREGIKAGMKAAQSR